MKEVAKWLGGNWGWVLLILSVFVEVTPIKVSPISRLLGWIGKKINGSLSKELSDFKRETEDNFKAVKARQDAAERDSDLQRIAGIKSLILSFANSCMNNRKHTLEEFHHVLEENKIYEQLVEKLGVENDVYSESYAYIKRIYRKRMDKRDFLSTQTTEMDVDDTE